MDDINYWSIKTTRERSAKGQPALLNHSPEFGTLCDNLHQDILFRGRKGAWEAQKSYKRWNMEDTTLEYYVGDFVLVLIEPPEPDPAEEEFVKSLRLFEDEEDEGLIVNEAIAEQATQRPRQDKRPREPTPPTLPDEDDDETGGIAKVLECRAIDAEHVYLHIQWLYRPHDLIAPYGPEPYHASNEIFPSTHFQLVDAGACNGKVKVVQWKPGMEEDGEHGWGSEYGPVGQNRRFCWRQTYDFTTGAQGGVMSEVEKYCVCKKPANLSGEESSELVQCLSMASKHCGKWLHVSCLCKKAESDAAEKHSEGSGSNGKVQSATSSGEGKLKSLKGKKVQENQKPKFKATWDKTSSSINLRDEVTGKTSTIADVKCLICQSVVGDEAKRKRIYAKHGMGG